MKTPEPPAALKRPLPPWGALLLALLPVGVLLERAHAQPRHVFDIETNVIAMVGRELAHGHWTDLPHYLFIAYQGSFVVDALASAVGFALLGDQPLYWFAVPLLYMGVISTAGSLLLSTTVGRGAAILWPLLLATGPFVVQDGLLALPGAHPSTLAYVLVALALAVRPRGRFGSALLAGGFLALGAWYTRTAVLAAPVLLATLLRRGWRRAVAGALGLGLLLPLLAVQIQLVRAGLDPDPIEEFGATAERVVWRVNGISEQAQDHRIKAREAIGWPYRDALFATPLRADGTLPDSLGAARPAGRVQVGGWILAAVGGALLVALRRPGPNWIPLALAGLWSAAFVFASMDVEPALRDIAGVAGAPAPTPTSIRYLVPGYLLWMLVLAATAGEGLAGGRWGRLAGALLAGAPIATGALAGLQERARHAEPAWVYAEHRVYRFGEVFNEWRGPRPSLHLACPTTDPVSRANHLTAAGRRLFFRTWSGVDDPSSLQGPERVALLLRQIADEHGLDEAEQALVARGFGRGLGAPQGRRQSVAEVEHRLRFAREAARDLPPAAAEAFLTETGRGIAAELGADRAEDHVLALCGPTGSPFCAASGAALALRDGPVPSTPEGLFTQFDLGRWSPVVQAQLVQGAGGARGIVVPAHRLDLSPLAGWPPALAAAFERGLAGSGHAVWYRPDGDELDWRTAP